MTNSTATPTVANLLSKSDVARVLGCGVRTVERLISSKRLPEADVRVGRLPRWRPETIAEWINAGGTA